MANLNFPPARMCDNVLRYVLYLSLSFSYKAHIIKKDSNKDVRPAMVLLIGFKIVILSCATGTRSHSLPWDLSVSFYLFVYVPKETFR